MRNNFLAWAADPEQYPREPQPSAMHRWLINFAVLAPSSHNTQPWHFRVTDEYIAVAPDFTRSLPASDIDNRQLYISLGCALQFLIAAAECYGLAATVGEFDDPDDIRVAVSRTNGNAITNRNRLDAMLSRSTNRLPYTDKPLPADLPDNVANPAGSISRLCLVTDEVARSAIGTVVADSVDHVRGDRAFFRELADYLLPNNSSRAVGMTGDTLGWSLPMSYLLPFAMRFFTPPAGSPAERRRYCEQTTAYAVIATDTDDPPAWIAAGRHYASLAIACEELGISTNNLAGPVTDAGSRRQLAEAAGTGGLPQLCARVGYAPRRMPHAPRLTAAQVTGS